MQPMQQQTIDFSRGEQLAMIRDASIVPPEGSRISSSAIKLVLMTIDHYGRGRECYACQETIARSACISRRQVQRAVAALESLSLLCVTRRRGSDGLSRNHYRIVWTELALLQSARRTSIEAEPMRRARHIDQLDQCDIRADQCDTSADQCDIRADQCDARVAQNRLRNEDKRIRSAQTAERFFFEDDQKQLANYVVDRIDRTCKLRTAADVSLGVKVSLLVAAGELAQHDVEQALEAVRIRKPDNRVAFFHRSLDNAIGGELNAVLKTVPDHLIPRAARVAP